MSAFFECFYLYSTVIPSEAKDTMMEDDEAFVRRADDNDDNDDESDGDKVNERSVEVGLFEDFSLFISG